MSIALAATCTDATLSIDNLNTVFLNPPATTLSYSVNDVVASLSWDPSIVFSSDADASLSCGNFLEDVVDVTSGSEQTLNIALFVPTLNTAMSSIDISTNDNSCFDACFCI